AITLNKAKTKEVLTYHGVPTPHSQVFKTPDEALDERLDFPLIVKPLEDGSSRGISTDSLVRDEKELANKITQINTIYNQPALAEKFLPGREFTVAVLGNKKAYTLPIVEIYLHKYPKESRGVYGYEAKTKWEKDEYSGHPEKIDDDLKEKIIELALKTHEALDCKDYSRIDIRLDEQGRPNVLEANPLPGLNPKIEAVSYFPKAARLAGMTFTELINKMLAIGLERNGITEQEGLEKQVSPKAAT
ncbi:MAG: ATP-grasp domain-containing protein, partial [Candidatus Altiarchaeota archaeon]